MTTEAVLVHDIPGPHPRQKYFDEMAAEATARSGGTLQLSINPGDKVRYPGKASLDAVRSGKAPLTLVNSAHLELIDDRLGFVSLPFSMNDEIMAKASIREAVIGLMQTYVEGSGLRILGLMRGADTLLVLRKHHVRTPEDLRGLKIRVAGSAFYQEIIRGLGAKSVVLPPAEIAPALESGAIDGAITSPGGWEIIGLVAPYGTLFPGLMFYTYSMIADKFWLERLATEQRQVLIDAAQRWLTEKWRDMQNDDAEVIGRFIAKGASYWRAPKDDLAIWKELVDKATRKFTSHYPEVVRQYQSIFDSSNR